MLEDALREVCREAFNNTAPIEALERLSSGASMETWALRYGSRSLILRRAPGGNEAPGDETEGTWPRVSLATEAELLHLAREAGVPVPPVHATSSSASPLGPSLLMDRIPGEALPPRLFRDARYGGALRGLLEQGASALARIHAVAPAALPKLGPPRTPAEAVARLDRLERRFTSRSPVFSLALAWLEAHLPGEVAPKLVHGDFRMGNLLVDESGLAAVLDWELAHLGDPVEDLAWFCAPSWRFGHYAHEAGGLGSRAEWLDAYRDATAQTVDPARFDFWLVASALTWGLMCLIMADAWRRGVDRTLERAVVGTRVSESELDLLLLLEGVAGSPKARIAWPEVSPPDHSGETAEAELAGALGDWVEASVQPGATGRARFEARVARNALGILERRRSLGPGFAIRSARREAGLGMTGEELRAGLRDARVTLASPGVQEHLRLLTLEKLYQDQPRYPGLAAAEALWRGP
ncbi:MAG: phosphotransferase family protein [Myxococcota bacterium]